MKLFRDAYQKSKMKRLKKIIEDESSPLYNITFESGMKQREWGAKKRGRPKYRWAGQALKEAWDRIKKRKTEWNTKEYDKDDEIIKEAIRTEDFVEEEKKKKKTPEPA